MTKRNLFIMSSALLSALLLFSGCSKPDTSDDSSTRPSTAEAILEEALTLYKSESLRGTETVYYSYYKDDTSTEENEQIIYDGDNQIIKSYYEYADGNTYENIITAEEDTVFSYIKDSSADNSWIRYAEVADDNNETTYDYTLKELDFSISEENGYSNIKISKDGTDTLGEQSAVKIKISADLAATDGSDENTKFSKVTREDIIAENDWTEESVMAIEGFSELLDDYVKYLNKPASAPDVTKEEYIIWIDQNTFELLQLEGTIYPSYNEETLSDIEEEFWNKCWEVSWIQSDLDSGISLEDALITFEDQRDSIEAQMRENEEDEDPETEKELLLTKLFFTKKFLIGSACPSITTLPDDYTETTQEDYYNEYSEDAYLDEEFLEEDFSDDLFLTE